MKTSDITDQDRFGVTLVLGSCAFSAELKRDSIEQAVAEIDEQLTEQGAPDDNDTRVELIMDNADAISYMVANEEIGHDEGVTDIAYSFVYALGKTLGVDQVITLRGLTGTFFKNVLSINPCLGEREYADETATLTDVMTQSVDGDWEFEPRCPPTLH